MPQLDPSSFHSQLFWLAVTFFVLYIAMSRYVLPKVSEVLQARQERISNDLDKAATLKDEAEVLEQDYLTALVKNREDAAAIMAKAEAEIKMLTEEKHTELDEVITKKQLKAEESIEVLRGQAQHELSSLSSELSIQVAKQIAGVKVSKKEAGDIVGELLKKSA